MISGGGGGGGGVEENVPEQSIYFFPFLNFFYLPAVKNKFFFVHSKDETIFFSTYFCEPTGHALSFNVNQLVMSKSVGSLVM